jgi:hypothetical protein
LLSVSNEVSQKSFLHIPAHCSVLLILGPNSAVVVTFLESSKNLGILPHTSPLAFGPLSESSSVGGTFLSLSHPDSNDSSFVDLLSHTLGELGDSSLVFSADLTVLSPSS